MKRLIRMSLILVVGGIASIVWAGPEEELVHVQQQRLQAYLDGNLDAYMATWAENGVLTSSTPFRIEGKDAIRAYWAEQLEAFPTRRLVIHHSSTRIYHGTTAVVNRYYIVTLADRTGKVVTRHGRDSFTWVKLGGRWLVVDQHSSPLPASP